MGKENSDNDRRNLAKQGDLKIKKKKTRSGSSSRKRTLNQNRSNCLARKSTKSTDWKFLQKRVGGGTEGGAVRRIIFTFNEHRRSGCPTGRVRVTSMKRKKCLISLSLQTCSKKENYRETEEKREV